jgi:Asp-tRNA(Asn)/Glu-tRNA(Gln) amidotransferase A subunit family amidase
MSSACELGASAAAQSIRSGGLSADTFHEELIKRYDSRMKFYNAMLNGYSTDAVRAQLKAAAAVRAKAKIGSAPPVTAAGPLASVPFLLSSNIDVSGLPSTAGNAVLAAGKATRDAPLVESLKRAGAIFFGHANTHELNLGSTCSHPQHGTVKSVSTVAAGAAAPLFLPNEGSQ